jgi:hypothetical protein
MQKDKTNRLIYSASDLVNFTLCPSITLYDLQNLETPLEKADKSSRPGRHAYEVTDTKLSKKAAPKHIVQLCFYSELLEHFQGNLPEYVHLKLGDGGQASFYLQDYYAYYKIVRSRYERFLSEKPAHYPIPCSHCGYCSWQHLCTDRWTQDDHLSLVADIRNVQIKKLEDAGINTLAALGTLPQTTRIPGMHALTLQTLREQAGLHLKKHPAAHIYHYGRHYEEAEVIRLLIPWLEKQSYRTKTGDILPITLDDILIVAPYNMQVNLLQKELPPGARVGTVDKFQGQEAEIVIVSMTTSSQEYLPRYLDFLFSRKRLNVALSQARCLAILVANPWLLETACKTVEQMGLILITKKVSRHRATQFYQVKTKGYQTAICRV